MNALAELIHPRFQQINNWIKITSNKYLALQIIANDNYQLYQNCNPSIPTFQYFSKKCILLQPYNYYYVFLVELDKI